MKDCQCISVYCPTEGHEELRCTNVAEQTVKSRDWGEFKIQMCNDCGWDATASGLFIKLAAPDPEIGVGRE